MMFKRLFNRDNILTIKVKNPARSKPLRRDVKTIICQSGLEFDIYWKDTGKVGIGPSVAVYVEEFEFLRFDCFGAEKGHFHIFASRSDQGRGGDRIWWREQSREQQIERTLWELENNLQNFFGLAEDDGIRNFQVDTGAVSKSLTQVRSNLQLHLIAISDLISFKNQRPGH